MRSLLEHLDEWLWLEVIESVMVHRGGLVFRFQNGTEISI